MNNEAEKKEFVKRIDRKPYATFLRIENSNDMIWDFCCSGCREQGIISFPEGTKDISCDCGARYLVGYFLDKWNMTCVTAPIFNKKIFDELDKEELEELFK